MGVAVLISVTVHTERRKSFAAARAAGRRAPARCAGSGASALAGVRTGRAGAAVRWPAALFWFAFSHEAAVVPGDRTDGAELTDEFQLLGHFEHRHRVFPEWDGHQKRPTARLGKPEDEFGHGKQHQDERA